MPLSDGTFYDIFEIFQKYRKKIIIIQKNNHKNNHKIHFKLPLQSPCDIN